MTHNNNNQPATDNTAIITTAIVIPNVISNITQTYAQVINSTIAAKSAEKIELIIRLDFAKKMDNKSEAEDIADNIKILVSHIDSLTILLHLVQIGNYITSPQFFEKITHCNALGQFYNFNFNYANQYVIFPENEDYTPDVEKARNTLSLINKIIDVINMSNLYEFIFDDIPKQCINNSTATINFTTVKKEVSNFVAKNNAIFSDVINVFVNNSDVKTFCLSLFRITKTHKKDTVAMVDFKTFLNNFQGMIITKIAKVQATIPDMHK